MKRLDLAGMLEGRGKVLKRLELLILSLFGHLRGMSRPLLERRLAVVSLACL